MTLKDRQDLKNKLKKLYAFRKFLYEKRNRYFETEFNKVSKRITEYLISHKVTHLSLSDNLATIIERRESAGLNYVTR